MKKKTFEQLGAKKQDKILLDLWAKIVKRKGLCEKCGKTTNLNAHHIYGRTNYNVRYDLQNGSCLCSGCHKFRKNSAHNAPMDFAELMVEKRGIDWYLTLQEKAIKDIFKVDKSEIKKELEAK